MAVTPNHDIKLLFGVDGLGRLTVDFAKTANGDLATVSGINKLVQTILRWLLSPQGSNPLDPTFGNPLFGLLGQPNDGTLTVLTAMVEQAEADFISRQQVDAASGFLALDEQVDHFENLQVVMGGSAGGVHLPLGTAMISFTVVSQAGTSSPAFLPFSLSIAS